MPAEETYLREKLTTRARKAAPYGTESVIETDEPQPLETPRARFEDNSAEIVQGFFPAGHLSVTPFSNFRLG